MLAALAALTFVTPAVAMGPIKVFILAGSEHTVRFGRIGSNRKGHEGVRIPRGVRLKKLETLKTLGKQGFLEWAMTGSNRRLPRCKRGALAN